MYGNEFSAKWGPVFKMSSCYQTCECHTGTNKEDEVNLIWIFVHWYGVQEQGTHNKKKYSVSSTPTFIDLH